MTTTTLEVPVLWLLASRGPFRIVAPFVSAHGVDAHRQGAQAAVVTQQMCSKPGQRFVRVKVHQLPTALCPWPDEQRRLLSSAAKRLVQANGIREEQVVSATEQVHRHAHLRNGVLAILRLPPGVLRIVVCK